ncbi:dihydrodipicolinate synthase family protein [Negadavirga shengliensis]|uniref:Dihydrodipicolinate synthase family protein n=1 Tax=Negadavirga shengliensis TaxID=1389218 RepID=A0ABV9T5S2_9BACT
MKMTKKYGGIVVPMVTPLTAKGDIDQEAVGSIMTAFVQNNISPLVMGTTGESASFSNGERLAMLRAVVSQKSANQQIYAGVVQNEVCQQVSQARNYLDLGADAVVATLPGYYLLTPEQMKGHFEKLADALEGPLFIYNIKATTQMSIPLEIIDELSGHPHIKGLKDSERDETRLRKAIERFKDNEEFSYFCGWGAATVKSLMLGADGVVPSTGNLVPEMYRALYEAALAEDWDTASHYQKMTDGVAGIYQANKTLGQSLAALKLLMQERSFCRPFMKPPLTMLDSRMAEQVRSQWKDFQTGRKT